MELLTSLNVNKLPSKIKSVYNILYRMSQNGIIHAGNGWCVSMSDIIQSHLEAIGVKSTMLEVDLRIKYDDGTETFIGKDNPEHTLDEYDTHVVVIAQCEQPILIDASISKHLPYGKLAIFEPIVESGKNYFLNFYDDGLNLTYRTKPLQTIPITHQSSIINRMKLDGRVEKDMSLLRKLVFLTIFIVILNSAINMYNFYEVYVEKNTWGPQSQAELIEKVNQIYDIITNHTAK